MNRRIQWSVLSFGTALSLVLGLAMAQIGHADHQLSWKRKPRAEQCERKSHKHDHFQLFHDHAEELGLDKKTLAEIDKIKESTQESTTALRKKIWDARDELRSMMDQDAPDQAAIMKKVDEIEKFEADKHRQHITAMLAVQALLTKEQRAKLKELREECRKQCRRDGRRCDDDDEPKKEDDSKA